MLNLDAVFKNPKYWNEPEVFRPERHLNEDGTKVIKNDHFYPFGLGISPLRLFCTKRKYLINQFHNREKIMFRRISCKEYLLSLHSCFNQEVSIRASTQRTSSVSRPHEWIYFGLPGL